jgi:SAM-dependent methyltransferase
MTVAGPSLQDALTSHLASWRLKRFTSDDAYFAWQRQMLSRDQLQSLHHCIECKRRGSASDEVAFYDATAHPDILPVLYSQRYDYYLAIGPRVAAQLHAGQSVLDFGCGVGILTTFYARQYPDHTFVGIDRSPLSIAQAEAQARAWDLTNVRFQCMDVTQPWSGSYDVVIATHALLQAEQDPGIPSLAWTTFARPRDPEQQRAFEARTGIGVRLDRLCAVLTEDGRMVVCEKTRQLARRVPFQRALAARGLSLTEAPEPIQYQLVEEVSDDGPFYVLGRQATVAWNESPEPDKAAPFEPSGSCSGSADPSLPVYENHGPSAQRVWEGLSDRRVSQQATRQEPDGRQLHVELGTAAGHCYLYCANTFDQRQLVVMRMEQRSPLEQYYAGIVAEAP